jgi:uncharacterized protein YjbI with pentapeptide repeats
MPDKARVISEVVVFCTLSLVGLGLFALIALANINWFYPTMLFGALVYVAGQRYFYFGDAGADQLEDQEGRREQSATLQKYLDQMHDLLIEWRQERDPGDEIRRLAQGHTLTVLERLDGDDKGIVVLFVYGTGLIDKDAPLLSFINANLYNANLAALSLPSASLKEARLLGATLSWANLSDADLSLAYLIGADLSGADLSGANLLGADLDDANLDDANLYRADLSGANLYHADLSSANLGGARGVTDDQLAEAKSLEGATMPNGQKYEEWRKSREEGDSSS